MKKLIIKGMGRRYFSDKVVEWYLNNMRPLPWRETADPYRIWLSEVILQQTRVTQGLPYYERFVKTYPSVKDLAQAPEQDVLRLWQGLGYYTRARNLHKCARSVVEVHGGRFPSSYRLLQELPGVGPYTAAAIASFAFGEAVAVLDGNVFRILARIFGIDTAINSPGGKAAFARLANELLSKEKPAIHNQAVMEFGALFCTPANPQCPHCPFKTSCIAHNQNLVRVLPVKSPKKKSRKRYFFYLVVERNSALLMKKRSQKDIWHGLYDFVLIEKNKPTDAEKIMADKQYERWFRHNKVTKVSKKYKHILTHQSIQCRFIHLQAAEAFRPGDEEITFYSSKEIAELPKPALISRFLSEQNAD